MKNTADSCPACGIPTDEMERDNDHLRQENARLTQALHDATAGRREMLQRWHSAICRFNFAEDRSDDFEHRTWMFEAKDAFTEIPRMVKLHAAERLKKLPVVHQQCSMSATEPVVDNHLTCCLGVECRKCPELMALESSEMAPEEVDQAKAWTCAAHIMFKGGDFANEGYLLTVDDAMFWQNTYRLMASGPDDSEVP